MMRALTAKEAAHFCGARLLGNPDASFTSVKIDSREVGEGSLFVAIEGERTDGHRYIEQAFQSGASVVLMEKEAFIPDPVPEGRAVLYAAKSVAALGLLSKGYLQSLRAVVVGVTGSVGKTSTKDLTAAVLSGKYRTIKTQGNYNNEIGLPLTLFEADENTEILVLEMGMDRAGDIEYLSALSKPSVAIVTNIGTSHLENFENREGILRAKLEIARHLRKEGCLILCGEDELLQKAMQKEDPAGLLALSKQRGFSIWTYGESKEGRLRLVSRELTREGKLRVEAEGEDERFAFELPTVALHNALNVLPALLAGKALGLSKEECLRGLGLYEATAHRMEVRRLYKEEAEDPDGAEKRSRKGPPEKEPLLLVDDTYNAAPSSVVSALESLACLPGKSRTAVLGDMFELGSFEAEGHALVGRKAAALDGKITRLYTLGKAAEKIVLAAAEDGFSGELKHFESKDALKMKLLRTLKEGDTVLFKASHGMGFTDLVQEIERDWKRSSGGNET